MENKVEGVNIVKQVFSNDHRLNYTFIKKEELEDEERGTSTPMWLDKSLIDYDVVIKKAEDNDEYTCGMGELDKVVPASYCAIKSVEEGAMWYRHKYPTLPDEFYDIIARYTWGTPEDNKPPEPVKKPKKKNKKKANRFNIRRGKFHVDFK